MPLDPRAFHDFEHAGWERVSSRYVAAFGTLTAQAAEPLLDAAAVTGGLHVLDVATGPGFVAAAAARRGASVTGLDFSAAMIARARDQHPSITFREGDAQSLPFADSSFDAVTMNFGLLHLARPETAIAEAHRVLRAGGRFAFTVWGGPEVAVGFGLVTRAIEQHGQPDVGLPEGPPFFKFSDADACRRTLDAAGFDGIEVETLSLSWRVRAVDEVFAAIAEGGVRTAAVLRAQEPHALDAIRSAVRSGVAAYESGDGFVLPMQVVLASGAKSGDD
jgi:SAM-dependent methyltransferase